MATLDSASPVLVFGASGPVGQFLIDHLAGQGAPVLAISRRQPGQMVADVIWLQQDLDRGPVQADASVLVSLGPLRHALDQVRSSPLLGRVVALSSASTEFKSDSNDAAERASMTELLALESTLEQVCRTRGIDLTLLKPTLIYGSGQDANITRIAGLVSRLRFVPYCGRGLRQPVHADDLARLIVRCLVLGPKSSGRWLLGGGETLDYRAMLQRIAIASGHPARLLPVPASGMKLLLAGAHALGRMKDVRAVMIERQRKDLTVDDMPARAVLGWSPRPFRP